MLRELRLNRLLNKCVDDEDADDEDNGDADADAGGVDDNGGFEYP